MSTCINQILFRTLIRPSPARESVRLYGRWMHRSPAKVYLPLQTNSKSNLKNEKIIDLDPGIFHNSQSKPSSEPVDNPDPRTQTCFTPEKTKEIKRNREEKLKKQKFYLSQQKVFDDNGDIIYEKLNENDSKISTILVKLKSKKERSRMGQTLVEGWRLIVDGLEAKCFLKMVIFTRTADLNHIRPFLPKTGVKLYKTSYKEVQRWSDLETSPGIFGVFETPTPEKIRVQGRPLPLQLICDNIRVPGNLGAILRVAVGSGCEKVILSKGCVDVWDPKVIRSAAGAHFRLPIYDSIEWSDMQSYLEPNTSVFIADNNTTSENASEQDDRLIQNAMPVLPYYSVEFASLKHTTLILGGETEGISEDSYSLAASKNGLRLNIPLQKGVDSLNTGMATAVIAFEIRKQLIQAYSKKRLENLTGQAT